MNLRKTSKFLSYILRHKPETIQLELDAQGWATIEHLLAQMQQHGRPLSREMLQQVVDQNDKQRFKIDATGQHIRANQGHSINVDFALEPVSPPATLYHGTAQKYKNSILEKGLIKRNRHQVHLSCDKSTALKVGSRHGRPLLFLVDSAAMHAEGHTFYCSDNGVWLTDAVPSQYLTEE